MRISDWSSDVCSSDLRLPALAERDREARDAVVLREIERRDRRAAPGGEDRFFDLFEIARGARGDDDVCALCRKRPGGGRADPAAGAGDERHASYALGREHV